MRVPALSLYKRKLYVAAGAPFTSLVNLESERARESTDVEQQMGAGWGGTSVSFQQSAEVGFDLVPLFWWSPPKSAPSLARVGIVIRRRLRWRRIILFFLNPDVRRWLQFYKLASWVFSEVSLVEELNLSVAGVSSLR